MAGFEGVDGDVGGGGEFESIVFDAAEDFAHVPNGGTLDFADFVEKWLGSNDVFGVVGIEAPEPATTVVKEGEAVGEAGSDLEDGAGEGNKMDRAI